MSRMYKMLLFVIQCPVLSLSFSSVTVKISALYLSFPLGLLVPNSIFLVIVKTISLQSIAPMDLLAVLCRLFSLFLCHDEAEDDLSLLLPLLPPPVKMMYEVDGYC